jgi:AcrR family transcriptional regulator
MITCVRTPRRLADCMARIAKYDDNQILEAATKLIAADGPAAATMAAIGAVIGASNGSIFHRFQTRDELLGRLWLSNAQIYQDSWTQALLEPDARKAGLEVALSWPNIVRAEPEGARIMLLYRRQDFLFDGWPTDMKDEAEQLQRQVKEALTAMTQRLFGCQTASARRATAFALIDIPSAAVRRYVDERTAPPPQVNALIARTYAAVIDTDYRQGSVAD